MSERSEDEKSVKSWFRQHALVMWKERTSIYRTNQR